MRQANKMYETAKRSVSRLQLLASTLGSKQNRLRSALVASVDRILEVQGWDEEDSVRVRA
jgi:flagellin-like hook-associated protein FlgL